MDDTHIVDTVNKMEKTYSVHPEKEIHTVHMEEETHFVHMEEETHKVHAEEETDTVHMEEETHTVHTEEETHNVHIEEETLTIHTEHETSKQNKDKKSQRRRHWYIRTILSRTLNMKKKNMGYVWVLHIHEALNVVEANRFVPDKLCFVKYFALDDEALHPITLSEVHVLALTLSTIVKPFKWFFTFGSIVTYLMTSTTLISNSFFSLG
ncbi:hypothetical protein FNV43_RR21224 [Rhamnella rubrinervis]|uniref:Uncharacterized protein n=1 Tax=Rhamnella rubrinervis TaxID=2594499 RepID=A0A8K0GR87_9ROSA|nr:hypothetical protein FNV43_RR21224 [Rhamnella rubrinervis]